MNRHLIKRLTLNENDEILAYPTEPVVAMVKSKMRNLGFRSVRNQNGKLVVEGGAAAGAAPSGAFLG